MTIPWPVGISVAGYCSLKSHAVQERIGIPSKAVASDRRSLLGLALRIRFFEGGMIVARNEARSSCPTVFRYQEPLLLSMKYKDRIATSTNTNAISSRSANRWEMPFFSKRSKR